MAEQDTFLIDEKALYKWPNIRQLSLYKHLGDLGIRAKEYMLPVTYAAQPSLSHG